MSGPIEEFLVGDTLQVTWVSSGVTPSAITARVYTGSETVVDSAAMVSSGNGHFYHWHQVSSVDGYYVAETLSVVDGNPFKSRKRFRAIIGGTD